MLWRWVPCFDAVLPRCSNGLWRRCRWGAVVLLPAPFLITLSPHIAKARTCGRFSLWQQSHRCTESDGPNLPATQPRTRARAGQNKQKTKCKKSPILFQQHPEASTHSKSRKRDIREPAKPGTVKLQDLCTQPRTRALVSQGGSMPNCPPFPLPYYQGCVLPKVLLINRGGGGGRGG